MIKEAAIIALICMSDNVYHESRGESVIGQFMVAATTMARAESVDNVCKTVYEPKQFSWTRHRKTLKKTEPDAVLRADIIGSFVLWLSSYVDFTLFPKHYYDHNKVNPSWAKDADASVVIGNHTFVYLKGELE